MKKRFLIALEPGTEQTAWGVAVPDLPGCFSAGDSLEEALANTPEAIHAWLSVADNLPKRLSIESHVENAEYDGWLWATVDVAFEDDCSISEEAIRTLGITEWNPSDYLDSVEGCAAYLREAVSPSSDIGDRMLLEGVSHIWRSSGYQRWATSRGAGSLMTVQGHKALIRFDDDIGTFRGEFIGLEGGADFYANSAKRLKREGAQSLNVYYEAYAELKGIDINEGLPIDPISLAPCLAGLFARVEAEAQRELEKECGEHLDILLGQQFELDLIKQRILKEQHDIDWRTPSDLCPGLCFD